MGANEIGSIALSKLNLKIQEGMKLDSLANKGPIPLVQTSSNEEVTLSDLNEGELLDSEKILQNTRDRFKLFSETKAGQVSDETKPQEHKSNDWTPASANDIKNFKGTQMRVHDDVRKEGDVYGNLEVSSDTDPSGYPKMLTIKGYTYEFLEVKNGIAFYKSTTPGAAGDIYRLEKNSKGEISLNQYDGDKGAGTVDISSNSKPAKDTEKSEEVKDPKDVIETEDVKEANAADETKKTWTAAEKAKPITLTIIFNVHTRMGNWGSAEVTTPDGETHRVKTGPSWNARNARKDLAEKMQEKLSSAGWTHVTLKNDNFDDWH